MWRNKKLSKQAGDSKTGMVSQAKPFEVSITASPANEEDFIYAKSEDKLMDLDAELAKNLMKHGITLEPEDVTPEIQEAEAEAGITMPVALAKAVEVISDVQELDAQYEKSGVKKSVQRPALLKAMAKIHEDLGAYLKKTGFAAESQDLAKSTNEEPEANTETTTDSTGAAETDNAQPKATAAIDKELVKSLVKEALAEAGVGTDNAEAQQLEKSAVEKMAERMEQLEKATSDEHDALTQENTALTEKNATLEEENSELQKSIEAMTNRMGEVEARLEKMKNLRTGGNAELLAGGSGEPEPQGQKQELQKSNDVWEGSAFDILPN